MAAIKWIKITTDIFDDEKVLMIESLPSADSIIVIWFKLLTLAGKQNNGGVFIMNDRIAYTDEMLASIFRRDVNIVRLALKAFEEYGMIEIVDNVITIPNWSKHQTLDAYERKKERDRIYQQDRRTKQRLLIQKSFEESSDNRAIESVTVAKESLPVVSLEEDKERDKEEDKERDIKRINYQEIINLYNDTCVSFQKIKSLSDSRKKAIKARLNRYTIEDIQEAFTKAEASDFLKGNNSRNWMANFDWIMKDSNIAKILDGNYDNKTKGQQVNTGIPVGADQNDLDGVF